MDFYNDVVQPGIGFCLFCVAVGGAIKSCTDSNEPTRTSSSSSEYQYSGSHSDESSNSSSSSYSDESVYPNGSENYPIGSTSYDYDTYSGSSSDQGQTPQRERIWRDCSHCHGKGTVVHDSYVGTFGMDDPMIYCAECGRSWHQSTGHSHVTCPICRGNKGSWSE